jgi:hypothetical protein
MLKVPFVSPETPIPATARPAMKKGDVFARAQINDPISKIMKKIKNVHFMWKCAYILPVRG